MTLESRFQMATTALSQLTKMPLHFHVLLRYENCVSLSVILGQ